VLNTFYTQHWWEMIENVSFMSFAPGVKPGVKDTNKTFSINSTLVETTQQQEFKNK